jgi:hypothetical protein
MNVSIYKAVMQPLLSANNVANISVFASIMAKAYQAATVGFAKTTYGATLVKGDTAFLESCINNALNANFTDKTRSVNLSAYKLMAAGFLGYWATATFTPLYPVDKMDVLATPTKVLIPGQLNPLGNNLFYSFVLGYTDAHLSAITTSLLAFQRTISGEIKGSKSGAAVIIPWTGII